MEDFSPQNLPVINLFGLLPLLPRRIMQKILKWRLYRFFPNSSLLFKLFPALLLFSSAGSACLSA